MFTILNRLRGEYSIFAKINGVILGVLFGYLTQNYYVGLFVALGYIAGESMGWGEWIGGLINPSNAKCGDEGQSNGIKWIASKFYSCGTEDYNRLALAIRGIYWWLPTLLPLVFFMNPIIVLVCILALGLWFPLIIEMAVEYNPVKTTPWKLAEVIYGFTQDLVIIVLVLNL